MDLFPSPQKVEIRDRIWSRSLANNCVKHLSMIIEFSSNYQHRNRFNRAKLFFIPFFGEDQTLTFSVVTILGCWTAQPVELQYDCDQRYFILSTACLTSISFRMPLQWFDSSLFYIIPVLPAVIVGIVAIVDYRLFRGPEHLWVIPSNASLVSLIATL